MDKVGLDDLKDMIETNSNFEVVNTVSVWSNGSKIRRFQGQNKDSQWHNPKDGYRKMTAILVELTEEEAIDNDTEKN